MSCDKQGFYLYIRLGSRQFDQLCWRGGGEGSDLIILLTWFDQTEWSFSYKEAEFEKICWPVKTSCSATENVNETPEHTSRVT